MFRPVFCAGGPAGSRPASSSNSTMSSRPSRLRSFFVRFDAVPEEALRVILLALPVDARGRAACVCRSWRAFLSDPSLWQVLDLTPAGGVAAERLSGNLARGAVARAGGQLRVFSLNDLPLWRWEWPQHYGTPLVALIESDGGAELQEVNTDSFLNVRDLKRVFAAAPRLQLLNADVSGECAELLPFLRNDPPYGALRVSDLKLESCPGAAMAQDGKRAGLCARGAAPSAKGATACSAAAARGCGRGARRAICAACCDAAQALRIARSATFKRLSKPLQRPSPA